MRVETKYIAIDGKMFDDEVSCVKYEYELLKKSNNIIMLDEDFNYVYDIGNCYYCVIKTEEEYNIFKSLADYAGYSYPNGIGAYYYDRLTDEWYDIKDKIQKLEDEINMYKKIEQKVKE